MRRALRFLRENRTLTLICLTTLSLMIGHGIITPVLPLYVESFGLSVTMVGIVVGAFGAGRLMVNVPVGYVAERYGRRVVMIGGLLLSVIAALLMAVASSFVELVAYQLLTGVGSAMYVTGSVVYITDITTVRNRAQFLSLQEGSLVLGSSMGPVVGGFAADLWGLRAPFFLLAALGAIGVVVAWTQLPESAKRAPQTPVPESRQGRASLLSVLRDPAFFLIGLFGMMIFFTRMGGRGSIVPLLGTSKSGLTSGQLGIVFTVNALVAFLTMVPTGMLSDRFGRKVVILPAAVVAASGLVLFAVADSMWMYVLASVVLGLGIGIAGATPPAWAADISRSGNIGLTMGLYRTFGDTGNIAGPVLLGWVADHSTFEWALLANAGLMLLFAVALWVGGKESVKRPGKTAAGYTPK